MKTQLNAGALALGGAVACAALAAICFAIYAVLGRPDPWNELFIGSGPTPLGFLVGIAASVAVGAFAGWLVAVVYNRVSRPATASQ